ncbi:hypothetical protein M427DRAFT_131464 [Gonapodya prolifera JEL478]|uniref:Tag1-like fifth Ig-like domain-containing protein n=1 Tax=Gonapodya prolifera (strain JEL478) TaxID=1344416 RepID=A0A139ATG6_GONPJ|nr:hypothetical protein M427DRAFT_131464 [Gonapodya prolifera JEL478]|eukprot:KXS20027.1 hypothetical protein M427DRAFT_131464 [Gonapodya prolifera JEL478]
MTTSYGHGRTSMGDRNSYLARIVDVEPEVHEPQTAIVGRIHTDSIESPVSPAAESELGFDSRSPSVYGAGGRVESEKSLALKDGGEDEPEKPIPKWHRYWCFATRARRWAFCCLATSAILAAILIPIIVIVIAPKIAQALINGSTIQFISTDIMDPREDGFTLKLLAKIENTGFLPAHIDFPYPVNLSYQDTLILNLPLGGVDATPRDGATINTTVGATIANADAFAAFAKKLLVIESFEWRLQTLCSVKALNLITFSDLTVDKTISIKGFNGFNNVTIQSFNISGGTIGSGLAISILADLANPSPIGIELGDVSFNVSLNGTIIGNSKSTNTIVQGGDNFLTLNGNIMPITNAIQQELLNQLFNFFLAGQSSSLTVIGTDVRPTNMSKPRVSWLYGAFYGLPLQVTLPVENKFHVITGVETQGFSIAFDPTNPWSPRMSSPDVVAHLALPFDLGVKINQVRLAINLLASSASKTVIGTIGTDWIPAVSSFNGTTGSMRVNLDRAVVSVPQDKQPDFSNFLKTVFLGSGQVPVPVLLQSDAVATTTAGNITISKIPYSYNLPLVGVQGLAGTPPTVQMLNITGGTDTTINLRITTKLSNPSNVAFALNSDVILQLAYAGQVVGTVTIANMTLATGDNVVTAGAVYAPQTDAAKTAGAQMLTAFINGETVNTVIQGSTDSSPITPLIPALSAVSLPVALPAMDFKTGLIRGLKTGAAFTIVFDPANPWAPKMSSPGNVASLKLPFAIPLSVKTANVNINLLSGGATAGTISTGSIAVASSFTGMVGTMSFDLNGATVTVPQEQQPSFATLLQSIFLGKGNVGLPVAVEADAVATVAGSDITISKIAYSTSLPLTGLQGLSAVAPVVQAVDIVTVTDTYIDLRITTRINNPSNVQMNLNSDVVLNLVYSGQVVGTATIPNLALALGDNTVVANARYQPPNPTAVQVGSRLITDFVNGNNVLSTIQGSATSTSIAPLIPSLSSLALSVTLPGLNLKANLITGLTTTTFALSFDPANPWSPKLTSPGIVANLQLPFALPLTVKSADININLLSGSAVAGTIATGSIPVNVVFSGTTGTMRFDLNAATITVSGAQQSAFSSVLSTILFGSGAVGLPVAVEANAVTTLVGSDIALSKIPYSASLAVQGLQGFTAAPLTIQTFAIVGGTSQYVDIRITTTLRNPSNVQFAVNSDVTLNLVYSGQIVGTVTLPQLSLNVGDNPISASAKFMPQGAAAVAAGSQLLTQFVGGVDSVVQVAGVSSAIAPLVPALASLSLSTTFPSIKSPILPRARFGITLTTLFDNTARANFDATNPIGIPLSITHVTAILYRGTDQLGTIDTDLSMTIPAGATVTSPTVNLKISINLASITAIFQALGGTLQANIRASRLSVRVGDYATDITYSQDGVPVSFASL